MGFDPLTSCLRGKNVFHYTKYHCLSIYCPPEIIVLFVPLVEHIPNATTASKPSLSEESMLLNNFVAKLGLLTWGVFKRCFKVGKNVFFKLLFFNQTPLIVRLLIASKEISTTKTNTLIVHQNNRVYKNKSYNSITILSLSNMIHHKIEHQFRGVIGFTSLTWNKELWSSS